MDRVSLTPIPICKFVHSTQFTIARAVLHSLNISFTLTGNKPSQLHHHHKPIRFSMLFADYNFEFRFGNSILFFFMHVQIRLQLTCVSFCVKKDERELARLTMKYRLDQPDIKMELVTINIDDDEIIPPTQFRDLELMPTEVPQQQHGIFDSDTFFQSSFFFGIS